MLHNNEFSFACLQDCTVRDNFVYRALEGLPLKPIKDFRKTNVELAEKGSIEYKVDSNAKCSTPTKWSLIEC